MTTYSIPPTVLYILQHSVTGLKYFGKTTQDIRKYKGSGIHWLRHCKKHPGKIKTIWVSEPYTNAEIVSKFALSFSRDNNIVESKEWANLIAENGLGGGTPGTLSIESRNKMSDAWKTRPPMSDETKQKISVYQKGRSRKPSDQE